MSPSGLAAHSHALLLGAQAFDLIGAARDEFQVPPHKIETIVEERFEHYRSPRVRAAAEEEFGQFLRVVTAPMIAHHLPEKVEVEFFSEARALLARAPQESPARFSASLCAPDGAAGSSRGRPFFHGRHRPARRSDSAVRARPDPAARGHR